MSFDLKCKNLHIIDHPIVQDRLSKLRDENTDTENFRRLLKEIAFLMAYEVTKDLPLTKTKIKTPVTEMHAPVLANAEPVIIPILRAGLGLSDGLKEVLTNARFGHIGVYRDEETHRPIEYLVKLPPQIKDSAVIVVDPMLATGHSMEYALDVLVREGVSKERIKIMVLVAAPEGVEVLQEKYADIPVFTAALDERLNDNAYIVPGLGDAGDRIFGTV
jgi:uracil phosphoribosyltransferase